MAKKEISWLEGLLKYEPETCIFAHHNSDCLKCGAIEKHMVRVGCMIFCEKCAIEEFSTPDPPKDQPNLYKSWLQKYKEKCEEEG